MWNPPTPKQLAEIPKLYAQEKKPEKKAYMKFFLGSWTWYAMEFDGQDTFFGIVFSPMTGPKGEYGYFSLRELKNIRVKPGIEVDREIYGITPRTPRTIKEILRGNK